MKKTIYSVICLMGMALSHTASLQAQNAYPLSDTELARRIAAKEQITNVPTIYIDIPSITTETELKEQLYKDRSTNTAPYLKATITVVDNSPEGSEGHLENFTDSELKIKVRGNGTASVGNGKLAYRLKFTKKKNAPDSLDHKHDLLGRGYKKRNWALLANAGDKSMLRNALTCHLGQYVGMNFCPGYKFVDLVISGLYRGTYQVTDHVEVGSHRIDINEKTGWYLEQESWETMAEEPYVSSIWPIGSMSIKNPETEDWTTAQVDSLKEEVKAWVTNWKNAFSVAGKNGWQAYNDVESFVNYYVATEITGDIDAYFVFKGYRENNGPFFWGPIWDKDLAYGNFQDGTQGNPDLLTAYYNKCGFEGIFTYNLFKDKTFLTLVKAKIDALIADGLYDKLCADIDRIAALLDNTQRQNFNKYSITESTIGEQYHYANYADNVQQVKDYLRGRITLVQTELQKLIDNLPAPVDGTYDPESYWWYTGITTGTNYNMTVVNRQLKGGQWNTFCLPFDATKAQMEEALGCTYELKVHSGMDADGKTMLFASPDDMDVAAGVPYLIKPAADVSSFKKFNDVIYSVNVTNGNNAYNGDAVTFDGKHFFQASLFHGYELNTGTDYLFASDLYTDETSLVKTQQDNQSGCRAFLRVPEGETAVISFKASEPTFKMGDVNHDGIVSVTDVMLVVDHILGSAQEAFHIENADINNDERITVTDAMAIVMIILDN